MEKQVSEFIWQVAVVILFMGGISLFFVVQQMNTQMDQAVMVKLEGNRGIQLEDVSGEVFLQKGYKVYAEILEGHSIPIVIEGQLVGVGDVIDYSLVLMDAYYEPSYEIDGTGQISCVRYERKG